MPDSETTLQLILPPDPQMLRIVRLVASGLASIADLDLDGVEEVRVAADELVSTLIEASGGGDVNMRLTVSADRLRIEASTALSNGAPLQVDPMVDRVLDAVTSDHEWRTEDGIAHGRIDRTR